MADNAHLAATLLTAKKGKDTLDLAKQTAGRVDKLTDDLAALARQPGPRGEAGTPGRDGKDGAPGRDGADGLPAAHEWQGTKLRFKRPDGQWGKAVDLKGAPGEPGKTIIVRGGGASVAPVTPGKDGIELTGLVGMQGGQLVSLSTPQFAAYVAGALDMQSNFARRADFVGETTIYRGEAAPGTPEDSPAWRIKRIEFVTDPEGNQDVLEKWAGGTDGFVHAWDDRAALTYL